jgi:transposase
LDVPKKTVVACALVTEPDGRVRRVVRTFGTMTADLLALSDWLDALAVPQIALESTGIDWRPVFNVLEDEARPITLVNPPHLRAVPGRKTDIQDSEWLADLLRHGLVRPSFLPPAPIRALRELTRSRKTLIQQRTQEVNRLHKALAGANLKLGAVASDILGKRGRAMLAALLGGEHDPEALADLARGRLREKRPALRQAFEGRVQPHHRVLIGQILAHSDDLDGAVAHVPEEIDRHVLPFEAAVALLLTIPGLKAVAAAAIVAEIGADRSRFPTAKHLASWAGVCPGNKQSGGRRLSGRTTKGNSWLRGVLSEVAWAAARSQDTYLGARYRRLARRRGPYRALVAVAHRVLGIISHVLKEGRPYADLGPDYFDRLDAARIEGHHIRRLEQLGYTVTLTPKEAA